MTTFKLDDYLSVLTNWSFILMVAMYVIFVVWSIRNNKGRKYEAVLHAVLLLVGCMEFCIFLRGVHVHACDRMYEKALWYEKHDDYIAAYEIYASLPDEYERGVIRASEIYPAYLYQCAGEFVKQSEYASAIEIYIKIPEYKDARKRAWDAMESFNNKLGEEKVNVVHPY